MTRLSVIIVSYNVENYIGQALDSVKASLRDVDHEIFVVDNASTDGSAGIVENKFPEVNLIRNDENLGFAKANNIALRLAKGEFIALVNPDTIVEKETFPVMLDAFGKYPEAGMIGCKVLNEDGTFQLSCRRGFPTLWAGWTRITGLSFVFPKSRVFAQYNMTYLDPDEIAEVDAVSGSFMVLRKEILDPAKKGSALSGNAGYLDERFFMYGEDIDWCWRIKQAGWKILYYPETSITHFKGKSSDNREWKQIKQFYKAMIQFSEKHFNSYGKFPPLWLLKIGIWKMAVLTYLWRKVRR